MADPAAASRPANGSTMASTPIRADPRGSRRSQFHARVRADALARQRAARGEGIDAARKSRLEQQEQQQGAATKVDAASAAAPVEVDERQGAGATTSSSSAAAPPRPFWARQLMRHEWMVDAPEDLAANWLVLPRPEGIRCLLVSGRGKTVARGKNGAVLHEFSSSLPGGGGASARARAGGGGGRGGGGGGGGEAPSSSSSFSSSAEGSCVLDAVFQPDPDPPPALESNATPLPGTFYALDVLSWGRRDLSGCDSSFRLQFWLPTMLAEAGCSSSSSSSSLPPGAARVVPLRAAEATPEGILTAVAGSDASGGPEAPRGGSFTRDGVLFLHKESSYTSAEANPLALVWKDASCSRYVVETDAQGKALEKQTALLRVAEVDGGGVFAAATGDEPPVPLAPVFPPVPVPSQDQSPSSPDQHLPFKPGRLLRFAVGPRGFSFAGNGEDPSSSSSSSSSNSVSADLEFLSALPHSSNRFRAAGGGADTLSKLLFQHAARHGLLPTLEGLVEASRRSCCSSSRGGEGQGEEEMNLG